MMDDDPGDGAPDDERALELSTIAAIYPELVPGSWKGPFSASIDISIEPNIPLPICFPSADGNPAGLPTPPDSLEAGVKPDSENCKENLLQDVHHLSHLPPLSLRIALPNGYPSNLAPEVQLETQLSWLPRAIVEDLAAASHGTWEEMGRDQSVFSYIDYLRDAAEKGFDLVHGEGAVLEVSADLKVALLDFDLKAKRAKFEQETFECGICLGRSAGAWKLKLFLIIDQSQRREAFVIVYYCAPTSSVSHVCKISIPPASPKATSSMSSAWTRTVVKIPMIACWSPANCSKYP